MLTRNKKIFIVFQVLSRTFLLAFGAFLLFDDLLWDNIGGIAGITGMAPSIGVVEIYEIGGVHIHHGYIGFILVLMASISLYYIYKDNFKKKWFNGE